MTETELILKDVSLRTGVPYKIVKRIWQRQWELVRLTISKGDRNDPVTMGEVYVKGIGRFKPCNGKVRRNIKRVEEPDKEGPSGRD